MKQDESEPVSETSGSDATDTVTDPAETEEENSPAEPKETE